MNKLKMKYEKYGIRSRVLAFFLLLVIVPFVLLILTVFTVFQQYASKSYGENMVDTLTAVAAQVSSSVKSYEENTMSLYHNGCVELLDGETDEEAEAFITTTLGACCYSYSGVMAAYIECADGSVYHGGPKVYQNFFEIVAPYKNEIVEAGGACRWYPSDGQFGRTYGSYFIVGRSLNSKNNQNIGIVYLVISNKMISDTFDRLRAEDSTKMLTDREGRILYSTKKDSGKEVHLSGIAMTGKRGYSNQGDEVAAYYYMQKTEWYLVSTISVRDMMSALSALKLVVLIISLIYFLFLCVMVYLLQKYIFNPVSALKRSLDLFAQGDLKVQMNAVAVGELKDLSMHFNNMTVKIENLIEKNKEEVTQKNNFRMQALVAQLKPHFIYNALNTIKWTAVVNKQSNIQKLTQALIYILMNAAKAEEHSYMLENEMELIRNYAVIQKARFMNFDLEINTSEEALKCRIPKFLIQPVVENSIVHGFGKGITRCGVIKINCWIEDHMLRIRAADNGTGFSVSDWRTQALAKEDHTNIGLKNIEQIIALEYGKQYGIQINSEPGEGTVLDYYLPLTGGASL